MSYYVQINKLPGNEDVQLPCKMSEQASGYDLYAAVGEAVVLAPGERKLIPTGIALAMPDGLEAQIRPRSLSGSEAWNYLPEHTGYDRCRLPGEIKVLLINLGQEPFAIARNERIAQMVFQAVPAVSLVEVDTLSATERGAGGFGHTGK